MMVEDYELGNGCEEPCHGVAGGTRRKHVLTTPLAIWPLHLNGKKMQNQLVWLSTGGFGC